MTQIIDFRNAKYQGQTLNGHPHGLGIMIDYKNIFCLAEWNKGKIQGKCLVVFGDSKIFYGQIKNKTAINICTYHLKDKCQVFCNFQKPATSGTNVSQNPKQTMPKNNRLVALLPIFNMIINVEGEDEQQLEIKGEEVYREDDFLSLKTILEEMLNCRFQSGELQAFLSIQGFIRSNFTNKEKYAGLLDILQLSTPEGSKQIFLTLKTSFNQPSLGIRIQNCMESSKSLTNRHNDGNSYIVKAMGFFTKEGILEYGLKNIKTLIKGNVKQQAIYNDERTIVRYENQINRPKQCSTNILNHLRKSPNFVNEFLQVRHLSFLQAECLNINFNIKETETKKFAQLILENPKEFTLEEKQKIEEARTRKLHNGSIQKNIKNEATPNVYKKQIEEYSKKNEQLQKVKQDIYRSVSKKQVNSKSNSPFVHGGTNVRNSPEKEIKPAELTNVKPILDIYKNTPQKSFYNSINKNEPLGFNQKDQEGYKFPIGLGSGGNEEDKRVQNKEQQSLKSQGNSAQSTDYFKNLESRRRLYEENGPEKYQNQKSRITDEAHGKTAKKKFNYLPEDQEEIISNKDKFTYQKSHNFSKYEQASSYPQNSSYNYNGYVDPEPSVYDPHRHYHDHFNPKNMGENYFKSQRKSPHISRSPEKEEDQAGKLGRRVSKRQAYDYQEEGFESPYSNAMRRNYPQSSPIIVPEFKIDHRSLASDYKKSLPEDTEGPIPKRQHRLQAAQRSKSPLRSEQYRKEYLQENSPIKKTGLARNTPDKYKYENQVILDPSVNYAKQSFQQKYPRGRDNKYMKDNENSLGQKEHMRSKSPINKRRRILNENPFDI